MAVITESSLTYEDFAQQIRADPLGMMTTLRQEGSVCAIKVDGGDRLLVVTDPEVAAAALAHGSRNHRELLRELVGSGLFVVASGEQWKQRRGLLRPFFTAKAVANLHSLVIDTTEQFVTRVLVPSAGQELDLTEVLQNLSVEIILRLVDPSLKDVELAQLTKVLVRVVEYLDRRLFDSDEMTESEHSAFSEDKGILLSFIDHRAGVQGCPGTEAGLLQELTRELATASDETLDAGQVLRDEVMSVFVAGVETMGTLLTWMFYNLDGHPEALASCTTEARSADFELISEGQSMSAGSLPKIKSVVEESLRLHPPAWALFRRIDEPLEAAGIQMFPGDLVLAGTFAIHRDPSLWDSPEDFRPERFSESRPPVNQYFPFGAGPHQCIGRQFSLLEAQLAAAVLLRHGTFKLQGPRNPIGLRPAIALAPSPHPIAVYSPYEQDLRIKHEKSAVSDD